MGLTNLDIIICYFNAFHSWRQLRLCCHVLMHDTYMYNKCNDRYRFRNDIEKKKSSSKAFKALGHCQYVHRIHVSSFTIHILYLHIVVFLYNFSSISLASRHCTRFLRQQLKINI